MELVRHVALAAASSKPDMESNLTDNSKIDKVLQSSDLVFGPYCLL